MFLVNAFGAILLLSALRMLRDDGEQVRISAGDEGARFLLVSGKPLREPIAWGGPIVMNTNAELQLAFDELQKGTFLKHPQ